MSHAARILGFYDKNIKDAIAEQNKGSVPKLGSLYYPVDLVVPHFLWNHACGNYKYSLGAIYNYISDTPVQVCALVLNSFFELPDSIIIEGKPAEITYDELGDFQDNMSKKQRDMFEIRDLMRDQGAGVALGEHRVHTEKEFTLQSFLFVPCIKAVEVKGRIEARANIDHMRIFLKAIIQKGFVDPVDDKDAILKTFGRSLFWDVTHGIEDLKSPPVITPSPFMLSI